MENIKYQAHVTEAGTKTGKMMMRIEVAANIRSDAARLMRVISKGSLVLFTYTNDTISEELRAMPKIQITRLDIIIIIAILWSDDILQICNPLMLSKKQIQKQKQYSQSLDR